MSHIGQDSGISYQNLFKTMTQGVVYQNSEGKIIAVNKAAEKILGLTFCKKSAMTKVTGNKSMYISTNILKPISLTAFAQSA